MNNSDRYQEALSFLFSQLPMFSRVGAAAYKPGLDTSLRLDDYFDNPHHKFKSIHIAGTNGKGSTSHMIASVLQAQGYKTGLYTSPHLVDFRERMKINGSMIPHEEVIDFVDKWKNCGYDGNPSFFELTMMMAFNWFAKENVDYAVIEVGMGGRLDSTNIIRPELSVITNISYDHNQFLGNTLHEIATEKAGIIKRGVPVVIGEKDPETQKVFIEKADKEKAPISFAEDDSFINSIFENNSCGWRCDTVIGSFDLPLGGDYQKKNITTVLSAIFKLKELGIEVSDMAVKTGIENVVKSTGLYGRWSVLNETPLVVADTGHNIAGITYNFTQLARIITKRSCAKLRVVIGFVADKAIDKILKLLPPDACYYITQASIPRALPADQLAELFKKENLSGKVFPSVEEAYRAAVEEAAPQDIVFIGGSTFIVADLLAYLHTS